MSSCSRKDRGVSALSPKTFLVDLEVTTVGCAADPYPRDFGVGLTSNPTFELAGKIGSEVHPIEIISMQERHKAYRLFWDCFLEISGADIPLTSELAIAVHLRQAAVRLHTSVELK